MSRSWIGIVSSLGFVSMLAAQTTWVVDAAGGGQFTDIQAAVSAAAAGDRIEVLGPGPYAAFVVDRGVDVEAMANAVAMSIEVQGVPASGRARVSNFRIPFGPNRSVKVANCLGPILLSDLSATTGSSSLVARPGLEITNCSAVFVDRGAYRGVRGLEWNGGNCAGALITNSSVVMVGTSLTGATQLGTTSPFGSFFDPGFPAVELASGHLVLSNAALFPGLTSSQPISPPGTPALVIQSGLVQVVGGCQLNGQPSFVAPGASIQGNGAYTPDNTFVGPFQSYLSAAPYPIPARPRLSVAPTTLIGTNYNLSILGEPALAVVLALDLAHGNQWLQLFEGSLHVTGSAVFTSITLDAQGNGSYGFPVPNVAALRNLDVFAQGCALAGGAFALTAPTVTRIR